MNLVISQIYRSAFAKMDDLVYLLNRDGFLIDCNHHLLRFLGFERVEDDSIYEMMNRSGLWTSEQIHHFQQQDIDTIISGRKNKEEQAIISSNGTVHCFEFSRTPLVDPAGNALGLVVVICDITKQKQLAEQLKEAKTQLRYSNRLSDSSTLLGDFPSLERLKILLVEDNELAQKAEKSILMRCKCLTDVVATPKQADTIFKPGKYDLVLMDLTLEEGDGYHLTATLRKKEQGSRFRVPIIALTGHDPDIVGFNCEDAEMDGILRKPLTAEQAKQLIQRYIRHVNVDVKGLKEFKQ